ncbi:hypothetical protein EMCRGX_G028026 [Ephydatia muelleri]
MENNGLKHEPPCQSPLRDLQQQILQYNNNCRNAKYRLKMEKADQYAGALDIHYSDGSKTSVHQLFATNTTTCSDLIMQTLAHLLHPKQQRNADSTEHGCLVLRQGVVERELGMNERPLELALDCSAQGLAAPSFYFKSLPPKKPPETLDLHWHSERSNGSLKHPLCHTTSLQPSGTPLSTSTPSTPHKHIHGKWAVSDMITRSLRVRKKPKSHIGSLPSNKHEAFSLISPVLAEKQFTMSAVMHIYYKSSSNEQYCKGVLVSEKSLTREVIAQALERCDLKFCDPRHFELHEVVGKWEEVGPDGVGSNGKVPPTQRPNSKQKSSSKQVIEEFCICFDRELQSSECPYNSQFFFEPSSGYSRRFELRKKENADRRVSLNSSVCKKGKVAATGGVVSDVPPEGISKGTAGGTAGALSQGMYYAPLDSAFILFVRLYDQKKEFLVHRLATEQTYFTPATDLGCSNDIINISDQDSSTGISKQEERISKIELFSPEFTHETNPICRISKKPLNGCLTAEYCLEVMESGYQFFVNGSVVEKSTLLRLGDLVAIGHSYLFIFYDTHADQPQSRYAWEKMLIPYSQTEVAARGANAAAAIQHSLTPVPSDLHTPVQCVPDSTSTCTEAGSMDQAVPVFDFCKETSDAVDASSGDVCDSCANMLDGHCDLHGSSDGLCSSISSSGGLHSSTGGLQAKSFEATNQDPSEDQSLNAHRSLFDSDTKEDFVIASVTERFEVASAKEKLLPASILATCVRYQLRNCGLVAAAVSVGKASQGLQVVLWSCTQKLADRQYELQNEESQMKSMDEILQLLKPVFFWLSNTMEFYNFLVGNALVPKDTVDEVEHSTLSNLQQILMYAFQQAFYTISKVLYHTLPVMIASCPPDGSSGHRILIGQVVDFLQTVLEVLNDLQVIFQLYSNLFYFINAAMFNYLVLYGRELGAFHYRSGKNLRINLDLLEGWACQQGFKSVVLNYMVKLSSVVDLLCIPPDELVQMDWATLRQEFPVLHAAQLHFILGCYGVNPSEGPPAAWTPTADDAEDALNASAVNESFDTGPEFCIPLLGYSLDPSQPTVGAQSYLESLEKAQSPRSGQAENKNSTNAVMHMPDLITKVGDDEAKGSKRLSHTPSRRSNGSRQKQESSHEYQIHELTGQASSKPTTPMECPDQNSYDKWVLSHFPKGSRVVTVPRGDKGFGVIMVEGKDNATDDSAIFVQAILPGSTASETNQLTAGDRILAIDCQKLDGADYLIAQKYLNEAEEEVVLVLAAKS